MAKRTRSVLGSMNQRIRRFYRHNWLWKGLATLALTCVLFIAGFIFLVWAGFFGTLPQAEHLTDIRHPVASEVYSADSVLLGRYYLQDRTPVDPANVPQNLRDALIATEDARFYDHGGVDFKSLCRVLVKTLLLQKESSGGGS